MGQYLTLNLSSSSPTLSLSGKKKRRTLQVSLSRADLPPGPKSSMMQQGPTQIPHLTRNLFLLCSFLKMLLPPSRPTPRAPQGLLLLPVHGPRVCLSPLNTSPSSPVLSSHSEPACSPLHPPCSTTPRVLQGSKRRTQDLNRSLVLPTVGIWGGI